MTDPTPRQTLAALFQEQRFAVLATGPQGEPYANLVAFAATPDLRAVFFATPRASRKYDNLRAEPRVALLIDSRTTCAADLQATIVVTALGRATELSGADREAGLALYQPRHPDLAAFVRDPATSVFRIAVDRYVLVDHFQHVVEIPGG